MTLKQDKNLAIVAERANKHIADVAYVLTNAMLNAGLIKDDTEFYGLKLKDCIDGETLLSTISFVLQQTGIMRMNENAMNAFWECIIIGDGDCPECGGMMEFYDGDYHPEFSNDRDIPPDYVTDWEQFRCPICGHIITHDYRTDYV